MADFLRSGRPSLDLSWTVRFRSVWPTETLVDTGDLTHWLAGTFPEVRFDPATITHAFLTDTRALREAMYSLVRASIDGDPWRAADRDLVNQWSGQPRFQHRLATDQTAVLSATQAEQFLAELAVDAIDVLGSEPSRLKLCQGPDCALPFLDESRGGTRRWCTAQRCGNRVNTRAYRRRSRA